MKNIQGTEEELELYHKNGVIAYWFCKHSDGYYGEYTYDENGNIRTLKDSDGEIERFDTPEYTLAPSMEVLEDILRNYLNKGSNRIDVTRVLALIKIIKK